VGRRTVSISDEVYSYIAERGRFGESIDDVLRRLFDIGDDGESGPEHQPDRPQQARPGVRGRQATRRLSSRLSDGQLHVALEGGPEQSWRLPDREDHAAIAALSLEAQGWAEPQGATYGQLKAIHKTLTEGGYYNTGPRR